MSVVRMFKPQFAERVRTGIKCQTVRRLPKRELKPGMAISLRTWSGAPYRSKQVILRESEIIAVEPVVITRTALTLNGKLIIGSSIAIQRSFAEADGFDSWEDLVRWFENEYGKRKPAFPFSGIVIKWAPL